jgi:RecQ-mediated genome instability protein 1
MDLAAQIRLNLQSQSIPIPSHTWTQSLLSARTPPPALPSLVATAKARLLAADLTTTGLLDVAVAALPQNVASPEIRETRLTRDVPVQVLDIENLNKSRWEQVEELEAIERGEQTRGREVIRLPTSTEDGGDDVADIGETLDERGSGTSTSGAQRAGPGENRGRDGAAPAGTTTPGSKGGTHRLVLQDYKGQKVYGLELKPIPKMGIGSTNIGEKIILKSGTIIARGTILLEPATCLILGGKVDAWQRAWVKGRLERLREAVGAGERPAGASNA